MVRVGVNYYIAGAGKKAGIFQIGHPASIDTEPV